jgi:hypothetical protein
MSLQTSSEKANILSFVWKTYFLSSGFKSGPVSNALSESAALEFPGVF